MGGSTAAICRLHASCQGVRRVAPDAADLLARGVFGSDEQRGDGFQGELGREEHVVVLAV